MKKPTGITIFGWLFLITGGIYLIFASYCLYIAFTSDCGLGAGFSLLIGVPVFAVGLYKLRIGLAFLKSSFKHLKLILIVMGLLESLFVYYFPALMSKAVFITCVAILYVSALIYLIHPKVKEQFK